MKDILFHQTGKQENSITTNLAELDPGLALRGLMLLWPHPTAMP